MVCFPFCWWYCYFLYSGNKWWCEKTQSVCNVFITHLFLFSSFLFQVNLGSFKTHLQIQFSQLRLSLFILKYQPKPARKVWFTVAYLCLFTKHEAIDFIRACVAVCINEQTWGRESRNQFSQMESIHALAACMPQGYSYRPFLYLMKQRI